LRKQKDSSGALKKYALLGRLFLGDGNRNDDYFIDGFIEYLNNLSEEMKLQGLKKAGIKEDDLSAIAEVTECKNNPVKLSPEELMEILSKSFN